MESWRKIGKVRGKLGRVRSIIGSLRGKIVVGK